MKGKFITLEGGEGAGKSTSVAYLREQIAEAGYEVISTREPGGTATAEAIREVLLADHGAPMPAMTELLLMFAARSAHIAQKIRPALEAGTWVISDRFTDASYAYQGTARGMGTAPIELLENLVQGDLRPDRVLLFDLPVQVGLARTKSRGTGNRFDYEQQAFHEQVRSAYLARAQAFPERYALIDAELPLLQVQAQLKNVLAELL